MGRSPRERRLERGLVLLLAFVSSGCGRKGPRPLSVPHTTGPITLDGEVTEPDWRRPARSGPFVDSAGREAAPSSSAYFLHDDANLYVELYAADEDIRSTDQFVVELPGATLHFPVLGPAPAGVRAGFDQDGTVDQPGDYDEEWVVEAAVPRALLGGARFPIRISRCDTPKDSARTCAAYQGVLELQ